MHYFIGRKNKNPVFGLPFVLLIVIKTLSIHKELSPLWDYYIFL